MSSRSKSQPLPFPVPLARQLLNSSVVPSSSKSATFKATENAVKLTTALLRHFIVEAVRRAAVESETSVCANADDDDDDENNYDGDGDNDGDNGDDDDGVKARTPKKKKRKVITVLPRHVSAIAADLIMDFS